jgi:NTF2 fold immunity protein
LRAIKSITVFSVLVAGAVWSSADVLPAPKRPEGEKLVERQSTAIAIAFAIGVERYGVKQIEAQKPLTAVRRGDHWVVRGHLNKNIPGGVLEVWVSAIDGRIIHVLHEQ